MAKNKKHKKKQKPDEENSQTTLADMKKFIAAIEKKYGKKALEFPVEVHRPYTIDGEKGTFWAPHELTTLSVAKYDHESFQTVIVR